MKRLMIVSSMALLLAGASAASADDCGRPVSNGVLPVATDALYILQSAVGAKPCRLEHCDVNSDCRVTASDSLSTLLAAIGAGNGLDCNAECPATIPCEDAGAPVCDGTCPAGYACAAIGGEDDDSDSDSDSDGRNKRATVCHRTGNGSAHSITVSLSAVPAHLGHGDSEGACEGALAAHKAGKKGKHEGKDDHGDSDRPREPECACEPVLVTTTTMGGATTTTMMETTTTMAPTTTTLPATTTTTLAPPTTTTLPETTTTTMAPTTTTTLAPTTTTTIPPTTTTTMPAGPDPAAGMADYDARCSVCHAAGRHDMTRLMGAPDLAGKGNKLRNDLGSIAKVMSGLTMTDQEIANMAAWLNSL